MKTRTDLKAGDMPGQCHMKVNRFGQCKKILCPYPPFKFPCYRKDLIGPGPIYYGSELDEEETAE